MSEKTAKPAVGESLEDHIFQRLRRWQETYPHGGGPRDPDLESDIYQFLYRELRGIAAVLPGLGPRAINRKQDVSCRFTSVLHKAFVRIIEKHPDKLMQARSRQELTGYFSRAMSNMMLNHYKRKETFRKIVEQLGLSQTQDAEVRDILSHLAGEKAHYFEQRTSVSFARGLELIQRWDNSTAANENARAEVLRLRYVDGLGYDDIASEMNVNRETVERLLEQARYHLRKGEP